MHDKEEKAKFLERLNIWITRSHSLDMQCSTRTCPPGSIGIFAKTENPVVFLCLQYLKIVFPLNPFPFFGM